MSMEELRVEDVFQHFYIDIFRYIFQHEVHDL